MPLQKIYCYSLTTLCFNKYKLCWRSAEILHTGQVCLLSLHTMRYIYVLPTSVVHYWIHSIFISVSIKPCLNISFASVLDVMSYKNCLINFIYLIFTNSWGNCWISIDHLLRCWYEDEKSSPLTISFTLAQIKKP